MCSYKHSDVHTIPLVIISRGYVRDSAVCGIYITRHIIIDVHHWNSAFQLTTFVYMFLKVHITIHRLSYVHKTAHRNDKPLAGG